MYTFCRVACLALVNMGGAIYGRTTGTTSLVGLIIGGVGAILSIYLTDIRTKRNNP